DRLIMRVNVDGVVYGTRAAVRALERRGGGAIIATSSLAGIIPFAPDPVYDLSKHAVVGFIRSVAPSLLGKGITANTVNPGMTDTNIVGETERRVLREASFPLMPPSQIAEAVLRIVQTGRGGACWVRRPGPGPRAVPLPRRARAAYPGRPGPGTAGRPRRVGETGRRPEHCGSPARHLLSWEGSGRHRRERNRGRRPRRDPRARTTRSGPSDRATHPRRRR